MAIASYAFSLARRGNSPAEYEDAFAANEATGRYALADGASESCFAGLWARLLVEDFAKHTGSYVHSWPASVPSVQVLWDADVRSRRLPWHAERGVGQGAFGAFLGVVLRTASDASAWWQAIAVGDACVMHTRDEALLRAFPLDHSEQFGNDPSLVGSRMALEDIDKRVQIWADGHGQPRDRLWMMTDALAQWCLAEHEKGGNPWREMGSLVIPSEGDNGFASWIERLRDGGRLRNDDVTLLAIEL